MTIAHYIENISQTL